MTCVISLLTQTHAAQVWNRDVAAAKNMLRCVLASARGRPRPPALQRQARPAAEPGQAEMADHERG